MIESKISDRIWFTINIDNRPSESTEYMNSHSSELCGPHGPLTTIIYQYIECLKMNRAVQGRALDEFIYNCMTSSATAGRR